MAIDLSTDGYCELSDVQAMVQQFTIDANSDPSSTEVEGFITQDFSEINAILRAVGYATPIAEKGGQLQPNGGQHILLKDDANLMDSILSLKSNSGNLLGSVRRGDFIKIQNDPQRYMITEDDIVNSDGEIVVEIAPWIELKSTANTQISYTACSDASNILKTLNATMTAIRTQRAAYSSSATGTDELVDPLVAERDRILENIKGGMYDIPSAEIEREAASGSMSLLRS